MNTTPRRAALAALATLGLVLTACTPTVPMTAAPDAINADCAEVIVRLPATVDGKDKRETDAQATAAWGSPASVLLHCGVEVPGPSTLPCFTVKGVDWLRDDSEAPNYIFTTYGRDPAVQVVIDSAAASSGALVELANAVGTLVPYTKCTSPEDVTTIPSQAPAN